MEISNTEAANMDSAAPSNGGGVARILQFPSIRFLQSPISSLIEYSGLLRVRPEYRYSDALPLIPERNNGGISAQNPGYAEPVDGGDEASGSGNSGSGGGGGSNSGEVSIRIIGEQDRAASNGENGVGLGADESTVGGDDVNRSGAGGGGGDNSNREGSSYQRYDIQQAARWIEQILPFSLLLLVVFIRQHLQGSLILIFVELSIWVI